MNWHDLGVAVALVLVLEGILPFLSPGGVRQAFYALSQMGDRALRLTGLVSMMSGVALLYLLR